FRIRSLRSCRFVESFLPSRLFWLRPLVREQSRRLSLCRLTFYRTMDEATHVTNSSFVRDAILPTRATDQLPLWREVVRLDEGFYESLISHPMPVLESAIKQIGSRSVAIDGCFWLAYALQ